MGVSVHNIMYSVLATVALGIGCSRVADHLEQSDSEDVTPESHPCNAGVRECDGNVLKKCRDGEWVKENCEKSDRICTEADGDAQCMNDDSPDSFNDGEGDNVQQSSDNTEDAASDDDSNNTDNNTGERVSSDTAETDTDTDDMKETDVDVNGDTDMWQVAETSYCEESGGTDQECFQECWECAIHSTCEASMDTCLNDYGDENNSGCSEYHDCVFRECCNDSDYRCLQGDDWLNCTTNCRQKLNTTPEALRLWQAVSNCVVCEACPNSCAASHQADFHNCADTEKINTPDSICYEEDIQPGEVACYSWAGWGGPCTPWVEACYTNEACWGLQKCLDESWAEPNWSEIQEKCFENVDGEIAKMFINQRQCIYCQACDVACLSYAGAENCEDYLPLY